MAQVPYSPVADVSSNLPATPSIHVDTPPAAFGGDIGRALSTLGQVSDQVGNEIFARAMAMQQLDNESHAREASANYMIKAGELHANFSSLQGSAAGPEAFNQYTKDLADARQQFRAGLSSPMAQKMFDADSMSTMGRTIFNGAGHSAEQMKMYALGASKSQSEAATNTVLSNPTDDRSYQAGLATAEAGARFRGEAMGHAPDQVEQDVAMARSDVTAARIMGLTRSNPMAAKQLFDKAIADGTLRGEAIPKVQDTVDKQLYTTGSKEIGNGIRTGTSMAMGQGIVPIERAKDAIAMGIESGGSYDVIGPTAKNGDRPLGKYQVMQSNLQSWLRQSGLDAMTPEEFIKDHGAQDKVFETIFGGYMKEGGSFNAAATKWFTGTFTPKPGVNDGSATRPGTTVPQYLAATNARLAKTGTLGDKIQAARAQADKVAPDKPLLGDYAESDVITKQHQDDSITREDDQVKWNTIDSALIEQPGQKVPSSIEELKASSSQVAQAVDQLNSVEQLKLQKKLEIISKQDDTPTLERNANFQKISGAAYQDPTTILDIDPYARDLTKTQRQAIVTMQKKVMAGGKLDDPNLHAALNSPNVKAALNAAGINAKDDPDGYNQYAGALQTEINAVRSAGKPVSYQDAEGIALRLLQDSVSDGVLWGTTTDKMFRATPPVEEVGRIRSLYKNRDLSDVDVQRLYAHSLFIASQRKAVKPTGAPEVPRSQ